jgi:sugar (pentulose or hexulose) kinase
MDIPIITTRGEETTALGAAITAAVGLGIYADYSSAVKNMVVFEEDICPGSKGAKEYATVYKRWRELRENMIHLNANNQSGINIKKGELI